jgi:conjugal transfer pilus assembly protein TraE
MKKEKYMSELEGQVVKSKGWKNFAIIQLGVNVLLALIIMVNMNDVRTIIVPPTISKTFWIEDGTTDPEYLRQMAHWYAGLMINTSPESVDMQQREFLMYTTPNMRKDFRATLENEAKRIKRMNASQVLFIKKIDILPNSMTAAVTGQKIVYVGKTETSNEDVTYLVKFKLNNGKIFVNEFKRTNTKQPFKVKEHETPANSDSTF